MYSYSKYVELNREEILRRVSQEDIFKIVIQENIVLDKKQFYLAPYRQDNNGGCFFTLSNDTLLFVDFANIEDNYYYFSCFNFISKSFSFTSLVETLEYINSYFKLGLGLNTYGNQLKPILYDVADKQKSLETFVFRNKEILYSKKPFSIKDRIFWSKYGITKQNLVGDFVYAINMYKAYSKDNKPFVACPGDIMYAYTNFTDNKVKIYRPYGDKIGKWFTNCNQNDIGSIDFLPLKGKLLIITKSYKDCRVLRNQGLNCIWFQNEGMLPSLDIIKTLCERFTKVVVWFDNDKTGITKSILVKDYINNVYSLKCNTVYLPISFLEENIKDPSDYIAKYGKTKLQEFLTQNKLL